MRKNLTTELLDKAIVCPFLIDSTKKIIFYLLNFFIVLQPIALHAQYSVSNVLDATTGNCDGQIEIQLDLNTAPHSFLWSNGSTVQNISELCPGLYEVIITDIAGCEWELNAIVGGNTCDIDIFLPDAVISHYQSEANLGQIIFGSFPIDYEVPNIEDYPYLTFNYEWDNGDNTHYTSNLQPGNHCVTITDPKFENCSEVKCFEILDQTNSETGECSISLNGFSFRLSNYCPKTRSMGFIDVLYSGEELYNYEWGDGISGSTLNGLYPGEYCVRISEVNNNNCFILLCFRIDDSCVEISGSDLLPYVQDSSINLGKASYRDDNNLPIIINEFSNGLQSNSEYVELLVLGEEKGCEPVDIRGFILDDNNGSFSVETHGSGIAPGHLKFPNKEEWSKIPPSSLIVIYNDLNKNIEIGDDDLFDSNKDGVYIIPINALIGSTKSPTLSKQNFYDTKAEYSAGEWSNCWTYKKADAIQIRYPDGEYCHGFAYGNPNVVFGGPDNLLIDEESGKEKVFTFIDNDPRKKENFVVKNILDGKQTPGNPNDNDNALFILNQCNKDINYNIITDNLDVTVLPNPFNNYLELSISLQKEHDLEIQLIDFLGRQVYSHKGHFDTGSINLEINLEHDTQLVTGVYYLVVLSENRNRYVQKLICIK